MRLLNVHDLTFRTFPPTEVPEYIVASHRWSIGSEAKLKDITKGRNTDTSGYRKVKGYAQYIKDNFANIAWFWIDTCCVNQDSSQEVSEAVNSMFRWYQDAELCIAFLADVSTAQNLREFAQSSWFRRGWTLQELIAPPNIMFVTQKWEVIGHKGSAVKHLTGLPLDANLAEITGIPEKILRHDWQSGLVDAKEIFRWMANRETTKAEDQSYCLFGLFDVSLVPIYGEGMIKARARLLKEVSKNIPVRWAESQINAERQLCEPTKTNPPLRSPVSPGQQRPVSHPKLECPKCPRSYNNTTELHQHRRDSHGDVFEFDCRSCRCSFKSNDALKQHMRDSHSLTNR